MAARPAAERTRGFVHFFARSARHILVEGGTRSSFPLPSTSLFTLQFKSAPTTTLPRLGRSTQVRYISRHSSSIRHILLDISETLTPPNPRYPCAIHSTDDTEATGKTPPPRSIGLDATAAPHRARRHRRAASGKKPPQRRKPPPRRFRLAASDPRTHDFPVHPSYLPSTHQFEFQLFVSTIRFACG